MNSSSCTIAAARTSTCSIQPNRRTHGKSPVGSPLTSQRGVTLDADDYLLVVPTDAATFLAAHPDVASAGVQVFGPYDRQL